MTTQLNSLRLLIKCSFQRNLTRRCSSQVQLSDVKQCNKTVRVRVAVSSTDSLRSNNLRLALYNYLFASANQGQLIVRIENLNKYNSNNPWNNQNIFDGLQWAGIVATESPIHGGDFGPYETNQRSQIYRQYAQELIANRKAYYCFCPHERLKALEKIAMTTGSLKYDGKCRYVSRERVADKLANNEPKQIRLKVNHDSFGKFNDMVRGEVEADGCRRGDPILVDFDGIPTNLFRNVVDDHLMQISHIFRGVEHLSDTPFDLALYNAFGWSPPHFAHVPFKMELRAPQIYASVDYFRRRNFFPLAVLNYLISCGSGFAWSSSDWSADMQRLGSRVYTIDELKQAFNVKEFNTAVSVLNPDVLGKCNRLELLRHLDDPELRAGIVQQLRELVELEYSKHGGELDTDTKHIENVLEACRRNEEIVSLSQLTEEKYAFLWILPESQARPYNHSWIATLTEILRTTPDFDQNNLASVLISFSNSQHLRYSNFEMLLRDLLNVNDKEAKLTDMMVFLGREKTIQRLRRHIYLMSQISSIQLLQLGGHVNDENRQ